MKIRNYPRMTSEKRSKRNRRVLEGEASDEMDGVSKRTHGARRVGEKIRIENRPSKNRLRFNWGLTDGEKKASLEHQRIESKTNEIQKQKRRHKRNMSTYNECAAQIRNTAERGIHWLATAHQLKEEQAEGVGGTKRRLKECNEDRSTKTSGVVD